MNIYCKTILFLLLTLGIGEPINADDMPYEKCNYQNSAYTKKILENSKKNYKEEEDTEACITCLHKQQRLDDLVMSLIKNVKRKNSSIPNTCFLASALRSVVKKGSKNSRQYYYCEDPQSNGRGQIMEIYNPAKQKKENVWARRICLSQDYINMTAESFNTMADCLGFSTLKEKQGLFELFNHESSFILNNRSKSGARCYGQLTEDTVEQIDKFIYLQLETHKKYTDIYKKALERCPGLDQQLILPKGLGEKLSHNQFAKMSKKLNPTCRTSQHPHTCFFYSLYIMQNNKIRYKRNMNYVVKATLMPKNKEVKKEDFLLPVKLPEILHVKGTVKTKSSGKVVNADWFFANGLDLYKTMRRFNYDPRDLQVEKINLYKNEDAEKIKKFTIFTAHNGGSGVISTHLEGFLRKQKEAISSGCKNSSAQSCKYRKQIESRELLDYKSYASDFSQYLKKKYKGSSTRKLEVSEFYKKLIRHKGYLHNRGNHLSGHLKRLHAKNSKISEEDVARFIKQSKEQCSSF